LIEERKRKTGANHKRKSKLSAGLFRFIKEVCKKRLSAFFVFRGIENSLF